MRQTSDPAPGSEPPVGLQGLTRFRAFRSRRKTAAIEPFDAFYQAYVTAIIVGLAVLALSGAAGGDQLTSAQLVDLGDVMPAVLGILAALAAGLGLRSGSRGGPIALEAADVRHVLSAPLDLGRALRQPILRQARFAAFASLVVGAVGGQLLARRTPGNPLTWTLSGSLWAVAVTMLALGCAWCAAGLRVSRPTATVLAAGLLAWPVADAAGAAPASPFRWLGTIPTWTDRFEPLGLAPLPLVALVCGLGLSVIGGISVEQLARRSELVGQIRFAATMRDLRTVLVLRRQLLQERPRTSPWVPWRFRAGRGGVVARSVWSALRMPGVRVGRVLALAAAGGLAARFAWDGTLPLLAVGGLSSFMIGLDLIEPLAQELDHETLLELAPVSEGAIHSGLLAVPAVLSVVFTTSAGMAGAAIGGLDLTGIELAALVGVATGLTGVAGAAISTIRGAPDSDDVSMLMLPPEAAGSRMVYEAAFPPIVASLGLLPLVFARRAADQGLDPLSAVGPGLFVAGLAFVLTVAWARARPSMRAQMAQGFAPQTGRAEASDDPSTT